MTKEFMNRRVEATNLIVGIRLMMPSELRAYLVENRITVEGLCTYCGDPLPNKRTKVFCSQDCRNRHFQHYDENLIRWRLAQERGWHCEDENCYCMYDLLCDGSEKLQLHHMFPLWAGGRSFDESNLILLCSHCHGRWHQAFNIDYKELKFFEKQRRLF